MPKIIFNINRILAVVDLSQHQRVQMNLLAASGEVSVNLPRVAARQGGTILFYLPACGG